MMRAALFFALFTVVAQHGVLARDAAYGMGAGNRTCAEFAQDYKRDPSGSVKIYFAWAQGYMTALDLLASDSRSKSRDLGAMSNEDQFTLIGIYCDQHPLVPYQQAILHLFSMLPKIDDPNAKPDTSAK